MKTQIEVLQLAQQKYEKLIKYQSEIEEARKTLEKAEKETRVYVATLRVSIGGTIHLYEQVARDTESELLAVMQVIDDDEVWMKHFESEIRQTGYPSNLYEKLR